MCSNDYLISSVEFIDSDIIDIAFTLTTAVTDALNAYLTTTRSKKMREEQNLVRKTKEDKKTNAIQVEKTYAKAPVIGFTLNPSFRPQLSPKSDPSNPQVQHTTDRTKMCLFTGEYAASYNPLDGGVISILSRIFLELRSTLKR
jgi:hypothetical protein